MHEGDNVPVIAADEGLKQAIVVMTNKRLGAVCVTDTDNHLLGIFTDGDLRRAMERLGDLRTTPVTEVMTRHPRSIGARRLAVEAVEMMETYKINQLLVLDEGGKLVGALNMHDLFRAKVV